MLENSAWGFPFLLGSFILFFCSILGWGRLLAGFLTPNSPLESWLLIGTVFAMFLPIPLSLFGLLNNRWLAVAFSLLPLIILFRAGRSKFPSRTLNWVEKFLLAGLALLFFCRFFEASLLQPHGDPLYYDLLAAAKWREVGRIYFIPELPLLYQASWWDYLYLWPAMFFMNEPNLGHMETHIFSQWIHFFIGFGGSLLLWNRILKVNNFEKIPRLISTFAMASCASVWWTATLAKNDWGATFLFLGGFSFLLESQFLFGGLLWGLALAAKWSILPLILIFGIWSLVRFRMNSWKVAVGGIVGLAPIVIRNYGATGNPLFPVILGEAGKEFLSESFLEYLRKFSPGFGNRDWLALLSVRAQVLTESPFILLGLIALLWLYFKNRKLDFASQIFLWAAVAFGGFVLISGTWAENRLFGTGIVLLAASGALLITQIKSKALVPILVIVSLALSRIPLHMPVKFFQELPFGISKMNGGDLKEQIISTVPPGARILTTGDNELYYLSSYNITDAVNNPEIDRLVRKTQDLSELLEKLRDLGFRYLLHIPRYDGNCWEGLCERLNANLEKYNNAITFRGAKGVLFDLDRL